MGKSPEKRAQCPKRTSVNQKDNNGQQIWHVLLGFISTHIIEIMVALLAAFVALYISIPCGFVVGIYPNTQLDFCLENGQLIFEHAGSPGMPESGTYISDLTFDNGSWEFSEYVTVINIVPPWWTFGHQLKPYRDRVVLIAENKPHGSDMSFANSPFNVEFKDHAKITGIPDFNSAITLKFTPNSSLAYGPHYITIKGIGQDGKTESVCINVLMVNRNCAQRLIAFG